MRDPVIAADGHTYDREAIEMWLRNHDTSPKVTLLRYFEHEVLKVGKINGNVCIYIASTDAYWKDSMICHNRYVHFEAGNFNVR